MIRRTLARPLAGLAYALMDLSEILSAAGDALYRLARRLETGESGPGLLEREDVLGEIKVREVRLSGPWPEE